MTTSTPTALFHAVHRPVNGRRSYLPPRAWLGYKIGERGLLMRVCSWCPPQDRAEAEAFCGNIPITHSCCDVCAARLMREITGEKESGN